MPKSPSPTRLISWNVNGLRAVLGKGLPDFLAEARPEVLCLQEIKAHPEQVDDLSWAKGYEAFWNPAEKKGYSGTAVFTKSSPLSVKMGMDLAEHDKEGRVMTLEFPEWFLVNVYTPNSQAELARLEYRQRWDRDFLAFLKSLEKRKPVIFCGDLNVAHKEIDLANPKTNRRNPGFTDEERAGMDALLAAGFVDTFRLFHPEPGQYTWWSMRSGARARNVGWRIDYWITSEALRPRLKASTIWPHIMGSDHCPVELCLVMPH